MKNRTEPNRTESNQSHAQISSTLSSLSEAEKAFIPPKNRTKTERHTPQPEQPQNMPKNKGKGGKNRRRGKNDGPMQRELEKKMAGQEYAQVLKMLGNGRLEAYCFDGTKRMCHIRGKMRKKVWVNAGDIVLVGLRDFQDDKGDVILKYNADEARQLKKLGEIPDSTTINETSDAAELNFESGSEDEAANSASDKELNVDEI